MIDEDDVIRQTVREHHGRIAERTSGCGVGCCGSNAATSLDLGNTI